MRHTGPAMSERRRDPCGIPYDHAWTGSDGTRHYSLDSALGGGQGPASWSSEHDCNPICGCHLASRCSSCGVCTSCDGCYCGEGEY
jgi:hypothetical protein